MKTQVTTPKCKPSVCFSDLNKKEQQELLSYKTLSQQIEIINTKKTK